MRLTIRQTGWTNVVSIEAVPGSSATWERSTATESGAAHILPGANFADLKARGDYDAEGRATYTPRELEAWVTLQIVRVYHHPYLMSFIEGTAVSLKLDRTDLDRKIADLADRAAFGSDEGVNLDGQAEARVTHATGSFMLFLAVGGMPVNVERRGVDHPDRRRKQLTRLANRAPNGRLCVTG